MADTYTELAGLARRCNKMKIVLPEIQRDKGCWYAAGIDAIFDFYTQRVVIPRAKQARG